MHIRQSLHRAKSIDPLCTTSSEMCTVYDADIYHFLRTSLSFTVIETKGSPTHAPYSKQFQSSKIQCKSYTLYILYTKDPHLLSPSNHSLATQHHVSMYYAVVINTVSFKNFWSFVWTCV